MSEVQRYTIEIDRCGGWVEVPDDDGSWLYYEDVAEAIANKDEEIARIQAELNKWESMARVAYEGRKICDRKELGMSYCGSCSFELHVKQMQNPQCWIHSSLGWYMINAPKAAESARENGGGA